MTNDELISRAEAILNPYTNSTGRLFGDVAATVVSDKGNVYMGACADIPSWGLCAERSAIAAMITNKEYKIQKVVAVWKDAKDGKLYVLPPCGVCREFMRNVDEANLEAEIVLGKDESKKLKELIPHYEWPQPLE